MVFNTKIVGEGFNDANYAHKVVHKVMHTPDEHKPCPAFIVVDNNTIFVHSEYSPANGSEVCSEPLGIPDNLDQIGLKVKIAAVRRVSIDGKSVEKACLIDNKVDTERMCKYVANRFASFGVTLVGDLTCEYVGKAGDPSEHGIGDCPVCLVRGTWKVTSKESLERLLVAKIGRRNFLGLGLVGFDFR